MTGLPNLPDITFADLDPTQIESSVITIYERLTEATLYPGDPVRLFLEALAYIIGIQNAVIDTAGKMNLLAYARDDHLDHLGSLMNTPRLSPTAARATMRYRLAEPLDWPVLIPEGSRSCTAGGQIVFSLDRSAVIEPGRQYVDIPATASIEGIRGNGLVPGQVNRMVDVIAYVKEVANIDMSLLGSDREGDEAYRRRIQLAPEHFSVAGPEGAYRYHTLSVHQDIADCSVWRPIPGTVDVRPILKGGLMPPEDILEAVRSRLNDKSIRPLTDTVIVAAPEPRPYSVSGGWYLHRANEALAGIIKQRVAEAVEEFRLWQRGLPGRDINPTKLIALVERAGAKRVALTEPEFQKLEPRQIALETSIVMEFMGLEDE